MRLRIALILCVLAAQLGNLFVPASARAESAGSVLISELQVAGSDSASDEFIELYNPTDAAVDLKDWKLEYHSASTTNDCSIGWTTKASFGASTIAPHSFYLLSSTGYLPAADKQFGSGLASSGSIRLVDAAGQPADALAWGTGLCGNGQAAPSAPAGRSLERRPGAESEAGGNAYNTGDNHADFVLRQTPAPQSTAAPAEEPVAGYVPAPTPEPSASPAFLLEINELYPDPAAPLTDAKDEFIELYNPNPVPVELEGYVIKSGANLTTKYTLTKATVPAEGYLALKSGTTKVALSNSGSSVALFDPAGQQIGPTITYPKAKSGQAWARADDAWAWTNTPTPGAPNIIESGTVAGAAASKTASSSKAAAAKAKAPASPKPAKAAKASVTTAKPASAQAGATSTPGGQWLLFALAGLTIAYVIYEFRYDIRDFYYRLRGYPGRSRKTSEAAEGRGGDRASERLGRGQDDLRAGSGPWSWLRRRSDQPNIHPEPRV